MPRAIRDQYPHFQTMTTRWRDNDMFGHINNVVYLEYVDTCVNNWLLSGPLDVLNGPIIGLAVDTACTYHASLTFPDPIDVGLRTTRIGNTSVSYEVSLFAPGTPDAAATASFIHVYVDRTTYQPTSLSENFRQHLSQLTSIE